MKIGVDTTVTKLVIDVRTTESATFPPAEKTSALDVIPPGEIARIKSPIASGGGKAKTITTMHPNTGNRIS